MTPVTGGRRRWSGRLLPGMAEQARSLGRRVASDDLVLLALSKLADDVPARRALDDEGLDSSRISQGIRTDGDGPRPDERIHFPPRLYSVMGRAEGFAAALGDGTVTPEHVLIALLWDPETISSQLVTDMGASRQAILDRLSDLGVAVPQAALPEGRRFEFGERVWVEREQLPAVLQHLSRHLPPEVVWGFNYEAERAWVNAESGVDLRRLVDEALVSSADE